MNKKELETMKQRLTGAVPEFARKIAPIYELLDWKWMGENVPKIEQIENELIRIINLFTKGTTDVSIGGLRVKITKELGAMEGTLSMEISTSVYEGVE